MAEANVAGNDEQQHIIGNVEEEAAEQNPEDVVLPLEEEAAVRTPEQVALRQEDGLVVPNERNPKDNRASTAFGRMICEEECNRNIYNAYLITAYRKDLGLTTDFKSYREIRRGLRALSYITAFGQISAFALLVHLIVSSSTVTITGFVGEWGNVNYGSSFIMWPFFAIAFVMVFGELLQTNRDLVIFKRWGIEAGLIRGICLLFKDSEGDRDRDDDPKCCAQFRGLLDFTTEQSRETLKAQPASAWLETFVFKTLIEVYLGGYGGFAHGIILAIYSDHTSSEKMLNTILNMLAYQFIMDLDEAIFSLIGTDLVKGMMRRSAPNGKDSLDDFFKGEQTIFHKARISANLMFSVFVYSAGVTAVYTRSWMLFVGVLVFPCALGCAIGCVIGLCWPYYACCKLLCEEC